MPCSCILLFDIEAMEDCSQVEGIMVIKDKIEIVVGESYTGFIPKNVDEAIISAQLKANKFKLL